MARHIAHAAKVKQTPPTEEDLLNWLRSHFSTEEDPLVRLQQTVGKSRDTKPSLDFEDDE